MLVTECLNDPVFTSFRKRSQHSIVDDLRVLFHSHDQLLNLISEQHIVDEIIHVTDQRKTAAENILQSIESALRGDQFNAMVWFDKAMDFYSLYLVEDLNGGLSAESFRSRYYYRARIGSAKLFSKEELFHLPFSKRAHCTTKRFSVPGLPCLYLSGSVYTCWEELGQPDFHTMQVARFQQEDVYLRILDLSHTPKQMEIQLNSFPSSRFDYDLPYHSNTISMLITWPLIMACSMPKIIDGAAFHEEYIIPQLLMQWVIRQKNIHGIKYFSNSITAYNNWTDFSKFDNFVFPPKETLSSEYCSHLCEAFSLTDPISYQRVVLTDPSEKYLSGYQSLGGEPIQQIELIKGKVMPYNETLFGKLEIFTQGMSTGAINF